MAEHQQPSANGRVMATPVPSEGDRDSMVVVKFLQDTSHPDYGEIKEGEILEVTREYSDHYAQLGLATDEVDSTSKLSREPIRPE